MHDYTVYIGAAYVFALGLLLVNGLMAFYSHQKTMKMRKSILWNH
jgi:hypothetical protein